MSEEERQNNTGKGDGHSDHPVSQMTETLPTFDLNEVIAQLRHEPAYEKSGRSARTLAKYSDFRIVLTVLKEGAHIQEHKTEGRITVQVLDGRLRMQLPERTVELAAQNVVLLGWAVKHDVEALVESAFLLTIVLSDK